jgi:hypothetical protein
MKRYSLDKKAPGMFDNSNGGWVKLVDAVAEVDAEREACRKLCVEHAVLAWAAWDQSADPAEQGAATAADSLAAEIAQRNEA